MGQKKQRIQVAGIDGQDSGQVDSPALSSVGTASQKSAMSLQGATGGGNGAAIERMNTAKFMEQQSAQDSKSESTTPESGSKQHYVVEIRAWIPHDRVVDPEEPARVSDWLDTLTDNPLNTGLANFNYEFSSHYRGDNHTGYNGSVRVYARVEFDWDGTTISGVNVRSDTGETHRDWTAKYEVNTLFGFGPDINLSSDSGSEKDKAPSGASGGGSGNSFHIAFSSANPLVLTAAPAINSNLTGTINANGALSLDFSTDLFPSHGIQVTRDGQVIHKEVVNDASGVLGEGAIGAALIGAGLTMQFNDGKRNIE